MSASTSLHAEVGGPILTRSYRILLAVAALGGVMMLWRFFAGLGAVSNLNDGYPWGIWIAFDVVTGTALGCGGYAVALLVYILNKGQYHPLVRPAILTSLLGYGLAVLAVTVDLGRFWELWKVPVYFWRWSHSPQLEVALCVALYVLVLTIELSPAFFEKWRTSPDSGLRSFAEKGLAFVKRFFVWILALGILLPTMHQSSLGTMMLLTGPKLHPLWFTPWLPLLFLVNAVIMGYGVVVLESHAAASAFGRRRETDMLGRLSRVAMGIALFFVAFRLRGRPAPRAGGRARLVVRRGGPRRARACSWRASSSWRPRRTGESRAGRPWPPCSSSWAAPCTASTSTSSPSGRARTGAISRPCRSC